MHGACGEYKDDSPLGILMHDFYCTDPDDMRYKELADRTRHFKRSEEGVRSMCRMLEEMRDGPHLSGGGPHPSGGRRSAPYARGAPIPAHFRLVDNLLPLRFPTDPLCLL